MCLTVQGLGVDALGVNCSLGPKELMPIVEEISKWTTVPIVVKANAGLPDPVTNTYNVLPDEFADTCKEMVKYGAKVLWWMLWYNTGLCSQTKRNGCNSKRKCCEKRNQDSLQYVHL